MKFSPTRTACSAAVAFAGGASRSGVGVSAASSFAPSLHVLGPQSTALLLALPSSNNSPAGSEVLREWSGYLEQSSIAKLPPVWAICLDNTPVHELAQELPHVLPFVVEKSFTWATVLRELRLQNPNVAVFGLMGEGVLPLPDLSQAVNSLGNAFAGSTKPTAILTRSRTRGDAISAEEWLPDTFIAQLWFTRRMLTGLGLDDYMVTDSSLLDVLPQFIRAHREHTQDELVLVDGTSVVKSFFHLGAEGSEPPSFNNAAAADGGDLYFGALDLALVLDGKGNHTDSELARAIIAPAPWPPQYVLETVADEDGLVMVNNVNCGYLDFATNFIYSVRKFSDKKVMWITMDDVAFDYMDALAPGCAAMFPSEGSERHHAIKAGTMGDDTFKSQVLIRPSILLHVLNQGYTLLWTDSDMVWMGNPLLRLPDMNDPNAAEMLLQHDGSQGNPCTCFLFMKPTPLVKELLELWMQAIVESDGHEDQIPFRGPLKQQLKAGLHLDVFPAESFPSGKHYFSEPYEENYARIHYEDILVVHNNYIKGHERKKSRFIAYHLWHVENVTFPTCGEGRF